jgi:hypothetical protein
MPEAEDELENGLTLKPGPVSHRLWGTAWASPGGGPRSKNGTGGLSLWGPSARSHLSPSSPSDKEKAPELVLGLWVTEGY